MAKSQQNLFTGDNDSSAGLTVGVSEVITGDGRPYIINLENPGGGICFMQRRKTPTAAEPDTQWVNSGGGVNISIQRVGLAVQGSEYRVIQTIAPTTYATKFSITPFAFTQGSVSQADLVQCLSQNQIFAFTESNISATDSTGSVATATGTFLGLLTNTAALYVVDDPDPELQDWFGGTWEYVNGDMRYLVVWRQGMLLSDVLAGEYEGNPYNGTSTGTGTTGTNTGTGTTGTTADNTFADIGDPPTDYTGGATLDEPRLPRFEPTSTTAANLYWSYPFSHLTDYLYEIVVNGTVRQRSLSGYMFVDDLIPDTENTVTYRTVRADGTYSVAVSVTLIPSASSGGTDDGGDDGAGTATDGTVVTETFNRLDMGLFSYADAGSGTSNQTISKATGDTAAVGANNIGYLQINGDESNSVLQARAYYSDIAEPTVDQDIWCRCWCKNLGDSIFVKSVNGTVSELFPTQAQTWQWLLAPNVGKALDRQLQFYGANDQFRIDTAITIDSANASTPVGDNGFTT